MRKILAYAFIGGALCFAGIANLCFGADEPLQKPLQHDTQIKVDKSGVEIKSETNKNAEMDVKTGMQLGQGGIARASDLLGLKVYGANNEHLGKIEDLVVDTSKGSIRYGILSFGGFLGMGDKFFAVPWDDLKLQPKGLTSKGTVKEDHYVLDISKDSLKNAPSFKSSQWPNFADPNWNASVEKFYGEYRRAAKEPVIKR